MPFIWCMHKQINCFLEYVRILSLVSACRFDPWQFYISSHDKNLVSYFLFLSIMKANQLASENFKGNVFFSLHKHSHILLVFTWQPLDVIRSFSYMLQMLCFLHFLKEKKMFIVFLEDYSEFYEWEIRILWLLYKYEFWIIVSFFLDISASVCQLYLLGVILWTRLSYTLLVWECCGCYVG